MSSSDAPSDPTAPESTVPEPTPPAPVEHQVSETEVPVELRRTVRIGRILVVCIGIGMIIAALASMSFPIAEEDQYTMAQIVGFMMLVGGTFGLAIGGTISLILTRVAKRTRGRGVAIQSDVR